MTESQKEQRLAFARKYIRKPASWWRKVVFSDEKKYYMFQLKKTQWCAQDEEPDVQGTWAVPPSVYYVWAGVSYYGMTNLCEIGQGLTADKYIEILGAT